MTPPPLILGGFAVGIVMGALIAPARPGLARKGKMVTWGIRLLGLVILIILFAVSLSSFYSASDPSQVIEGSPAKGVDWDSTDFPTF